MNTDTMKYEKLKNAMLALKNLVFSMRSIKIISEDSQYNIGFNAALNIVVNELYNIGE